MGIAVLGVGCFLSVVYSANALEQRQTLSAEAIGTSIETMLPANAKWTLSAVDVKSGERLVSVGSAGNDALLPGSVMKLILAAAILDAHAAETLDLSTSISHDGSIRDGNLDGSIYLKGSGNSLLRVRDLESAVGEIRSRNVSSVAGDIIVDEGLFDLCGWGQGYSGAAYAVPSALGLDLNTVSISRSVDQLRARIDPPNDEVRILFDSEGKPGIRQINDLTYEITGPANGGAQIQKRFPLQDPSLYAAMTFRTLLRQQGISVRGVIRKATTPPLTSEIVRLRAPSLEKIVESMNHESLNVVAENLFLLLGARKYGEPGTRAKGALALTEFMKELDVIPEGVVVADGSGLSSESRLSSPQIASLLAKVSKKPWFNSFYTSIPRAGLDGNIRNLSPQRENVRAKTGQLRDAYGLAGYSDAKGRRDGFSFMVNVPGAELLWSRGAEFIALLEMI